MASFVEIQKNNLSKKSKEIEKISKDTMDDIYDRLNNEIKMRGGYQSIKPFQANKTALNESGEKATVDRFNDAMLTRPYINTNSNLYEN